MRHFWISIPRALPLGLIALGLMLVAAPAQADHPVNILDATLAAKGETIYVRNCARCHGMNLTGPKNPKKFKKLPPRLDARVGHVAHHDDQSIFNQVTRGSLDKNGKPLAGGMRGFAEKLDPGEIWAVVTYVKSRWPDDVYRKQHMRNPGHGSMGKGGGHGHH
jgi:mono/diheme cytochrome c family protein